MTEPTWRISSHTASGGTCVEVGWRVSSHSSDGNCCVEVNDLHPDTVLIRHSHHPDGPVLTFTRAEWVAFGKGFKDGEFDLPPSDNEPSTGDGSC